MKLSRSTDHIRPYKRARVIAAMFVAVLLAGGFFAGSAFALTPQEALQQAQEAAKRAAAGEERIDALRKEIATLDEQASTFVRQAQELEPQIDSASEMTELLTLELRDLEELAEQLRSNIASTTAEFEKQQELVGARMSETYKQGDTFFFDLLLSATSFRDLITRFEYVQRAIESNLLYARELSLIRRTLETDKEQLDAIVAEAAVKQQEAVDLESNLRSLKASREQAANNAAAIQGAREQLMRETQADVEAARALQAEMYAQAFASIGNAPMGSGEFAGVFVFPVQGSWNSSCGFGCGCNIHGGRHFGKDFGTFNGTPPIVAVAPGVVTTASIGWNGGYGNLVAIDHGNGVMTRYAHLSSIAVSAGQTVGAGQVIGNAGSTGASFGNHLHFEVIINGQFQDPMRWF
ncbi:MAG: peptidoglycan DD-metalloendopeptidase family protein [Coriobacteriia bacterium]|nr:peptidoglycan DD-metalloendopeptidase family protein [Coriobacteriia bacterium]